MKKITLTAQLLLVSAILLTSGCMWSRAKINDPTIGDRVRLIKPGVTKGKNVARILGAQPTLRMPGKETALFGYTYGDTKSNGLMLIVFNFMRSTTVTDTLYIEIDTETGIVTNVYPPNKHEIEWKFWPFGDE